MRIFAYLLLGIIPAYSAFAEDATEVVVVANRVPVAASQVASSLTVIDQEQLESKENTTVTDALRGVPGLDVVQSGGRGGNAAVFMRGANSEHTLVLIDGVEANNPINPARSYNFGNLTLENVEKVEVLRGPQSTLYGSDALGGVISITTKRGTKAPNSYLSFLGGSYSTFEEQAGINGLKDKLDYSLAVARADSDGISSAKADLGNSEHDRYSDNSFSGKFGYESDKDFQSLLSFRYLDAKSDLDSMGGIGGDDPNRKLKDQELFVRGEEHVSFFAGQLKSVAGISYMNQSFDDNDDPDALHMLDLLRSNYDGSNLKFDLQNSVDAFENLKFLIGLETEEEKASSNYHSESMFGPFDSDFAEREARSSGYYGEARASAFDRLYSSFGVRVDEHEKFGSEVTYRLAPALLFKETGTKLSSTVGTGFKAPSLFQLYSQYGREDLNPEESLGGDAGIEQKLLDGILTVGATYFWNRFDNLITFDPNTFLFDNISKAETHGAEISAQVQASESLSFGTSFTALRTEDRNTHQELLRRPKTKLGFDCLYRIGEKGRVNLGVVFTGSRIDNDFSSFPASRVSLKGYTLINAAASYEVMKNVDLILRVDNIGDVDYEEVLGYGTRGASAYGGFRVRM